MKRKMLLVAIVATTIFGCTKEDNTLSSSANPTTDNLSTSRDAKSSRYLTWVGSGPGTVEPDCFTGNGNCLPTFEVVGKTMYEQLTFAVKTDNQVTFFNNNNYVDVFGGEELTQIESNHQIQDALEKGHLKFKIISTSTVDYCLILKPQHEHFDPEQLANKVVLVIPVMR